MFEPKLHMPTNDGAEHPPARDHAQSEGADQTQLRAVRWSDLSARLAAARELRAQMRRETDAAMARFIDTAAGLMVPPRPASPNGKRPVNPEISEHRKACGPIAAKGLDDLGKPTSSASRQES